MFGYSFLRSTTTTTTTTTAITKATTTSSALSQTMMKSISNLARVIATSFVSTIMLRPLSIILPESVVDSAAAVATTNNNTNTNGGGVSSSSQSSAVMRGGGGGGGTRRRLRSSSISEAKERGGSMVTKLYEFALVGWNHHHHHHSASATVVSCNSVDHYSRGQQQQQQQQRMTFISSDKMVHPSNNNWGAVLHTHHQGSGSSSGNTTSTTTTSSSLRSFSTNNNNNNNNSPHSSSSSSSSKLSSTRAQNAIALLPSYLLDARSVTKYHPDTAPNGALQLSVAENQLSELPVGGVFGVVEDDGDLEVQQQRQSGDDDDGDGGERTTTTTTTTDGDEMTLVQVLSQLASSTVPRPSSSSLDDTSSSSSLLTFEKDMIYYQPTQGSPGLRSAMADYLHDLLLTSSSSSPASVSSSLTFNPENIILGAGCNAVLENLCLCLTEPGDAVMIPTPYYAAFEFDLVARAGCEIVSVNTLDFQDVSPPPLSSSSSSSSSAVEGGATNGGDGDKKKKKRTTIPPSFYYPNKASLTHAYNLSIERTSRPPRVLLLSHPNNPLGICYPPEVMVECIEWCREYEVHLISDEIYAGSVYRQKTTTKKKSDGSGEDDTFVSAMSLASSSTSSSSSSGGGGGGGDGGGKDGGLGLGPYVHLVYALSKDFALSGLRVGVAYTENTEILVPLQKLNDLCQISSQTQLLVERMLSANAVGDGNGNDKKKFADVYLKSNRHNIQTRCDKLQSCLTDVDIPYLPADSGLFVWMDFREFLPSLPSDDVSITEENESVSSKEHRERGLYLKLMKEYGLLFTPGMSMRNERPGFFRCVFTAASEEEFELGLDRIRKFVVEQRAVSGN